MKRRIVSLLLVLVMCLSLCACGAKLKEEHAAILCGTWYQQRDQKMEANPGYFELKNDLTGTFNGKDPFTWTAKVDRENKQMLVVTIKTEAKEKLTFTVYTGDEIVHDAFLSGEKSGIAGQYLKVDTDTKQEWFNDLLDEWTAEDESATVQTVTLKGDGTVMVNGANYFWTNSIDSYYSDGDRVHLAVFNEAGIHGFIEVYPDGNGNYSFFYYDLDVGRSCNYFNHPMLKMISDGSWESFDHFTMIDNYFYIGPWYETTTIADVEYEVQFDTKSSKDELTVNLLENGNVRYVVRFFKEGDYLMATLTDQQSGQETLYYNEYLGYDVNHPDKLYYDTIGLAYRYANDYSVYNLDTDEYIDREDRLPYIYEKLAELNGYKQAQEFLDRFTVVPSKLTAQMRYYTDNLNNVSSNWDNYYNYDETGKIISARGDEIIEQYGVYETWNYQNLNWNEDGSLAEIQVKSGDTLYAVATPTYDENGNLITMSVQEQSEAYVSTFTYDDQGRRIRLEIEKAVYGAPMTFDYTYDDSGKLVTKVKTWDDGYYTSTYTYTYDGDVLVQMDHLYEYGRYSTSGYTTTYVYTNDEQGRPLSAAVTSTKPDYSYKAQEVKYIYEDIYFFDTTGLVFED